MHNCQIILTIQQIPWPMIPYWKQMSDFQLLPEICVHSTKCTCDHCTAWQTWSGSQHLGLDFDYSACCCQKQKHSGKLLSELLFWFMHLVCCYLLDLEQTANFQGNCVCVSIYSKPEAYYEGVEQLCIGNAYIWIPAVTFRLQILDSETLSMGL